MCYCTKLMCYYYFRQLINCIIASGSKKCTMNFDPVTKDTPIHSFFISSTSHAKITSWSVAPDDKVRRGVVLLSYTLNDGGGQSDCRQLKSTLVGVVRERTYNVGDIVPPGYVIACEVT